MPNKFTHMPICTFQNNHAKDDDVESEESSVEASNDKGGYETDELDIIRSYVVERGATPMTGTLRSSSPW